MKIFLGVLMVLIVSGDDEIVTVTGVLDGSVLLPCNCSERDLDQEFRWQMEGPNRMAVLIHNKALSDFTPRYQGRAEKFLSENSNNCSILLTDITVDDVGKYRCRFRSQGTYKRFYVDLNISVSYNVCQWSAENLGGDSSVKVFQCDAAGPYREAAIQWTLDGKPLTNSDTTNITLTIKADPRGFYRFTSQLTTKLNGTSEPKCGVKAENLSTIISDNCKSDTEHLIETRPLNLRCRYLTAFPIMLVLGFSLLLWHWKKSKRLPKRREVETDGI